MILFSRIVSLYSDTSIEEQKKAPILLAVVLILILLLPVIMISDFINKDYMPLAMEGVLLVLMLIATLLIFKKKYSVAASMLINIVTIVMLAIFFLEIDPAYYFKSFKYIYFLIPSIVLAAVFGRRLLQLNLIFIINISIYSCVFFILLFPDYSRLKPIGDIINQYIVSSVIYTIIYLLLFQFLRINKQMITWVREQLDVNRKNVQQLRQLINDVLETMKQNDDMEGEIQQTTSKVQQITELKEKIARLTEKQEKNIDLSGTAIRNIRKEIGELQAAVSEQGAAVAKTSSSIEEINQSINNIGNIANEKIISSYKLIALTDEGKSKLGAVGDAFKAISGSAEHILEITDIINSIASQTNLLAMNAAIEAAHAGDKGRGFAVVAEEIRKMAESSSDNATQITGFIKPVIQAIANTGQEVEKTQQAFEQISHEIQVSIEAFTEIVVSIKELAGGSSEILRLSTHLNSLTASVRDNSNDIDSAEKEVTTNINSFANDSREIEEWLQSITSGIDTINQSIHNLQVLSSLLSISAKKTRSVIDGISF